MGVAAETGLLLLLVLLLPLVFGLRLVAAAAAYELATGCDTIKAGRGVTCGRTLAADKARSEME